MLLHQLVTHVVLAELYRWVLLQATVAATPELRLVADHAVLRHVVLVAVADVAQLPHHVAVQALAQFARSCKRSSAAVAADATAVAVQLQAADAKLLLQAAVAKLLLPADASRMK